MRISDFLPEGKENAIPGHDLVALLKLDDLRSLTQLVEQERRDGFPIRASTGNDKGYYLASGPEELEAYISSLDRRLSNVRRTRRHLEDTLYKMTGQERIGG